MTGVAGRHHEDLTGQRFGRLVAETYLGASVWECRCDCGEKLLLQARQLKTGNTKSCGCLKIDKQTKHGGAKKDGSRERLYNVWTGMRARCNNPHSISYKWYGAKGVKVCEEWNDYSKFKEWSLKNGYNRYAPRGICTIDRIDVNGDYEPSNCRWVDMSIQANNTRRNAKDE